MPLPGKAGGPIMAVPKPKAPKPAPVKKVVPEGTAALETWCALHCSCSLCASLRFLKSECSFLMWVNVARAVKALYLS